MKAHQVVRDPSLMTQTHGGSLCHSTALWITGHVDIYTTLGLFLNVHSLTDKLTNLPDKLDFDPIVLQPLSRNFESHINFPTYSFTVIEKEIFVLFPIFSLVLSFLPGLGVIQHDVDLGGLSEAEEAHV